jgi:hypothetical protein
LAWRALAWGALAWGALAWGALAWGALAWRGPRAGGATAVADERIVTGRGSHIDLEKSIDVFSAIDGLSWTYE